MSDENNPLAWAEKAEQDYEMAVSALRRKKPNIYGACFHAQQCAEKYLKSMLVAKKKQFPRTHDLLTLTGLNEKEGIFLGLDQKADK